MSTTRNTPNEKQAQTALEAVDRFGDRLERLAASDLPIAPYAAAILERAEEQSGGDDGAE